MSLKTYQARSMAEALGRVKQDLGRDAVILHTRTVKRGGLFGIGSRQMVEIVASRATDLVTRGGPTTDAERLPRRALLAAGAGGSSTKAASPSANAVTTRSEIGRPAAEVARSAIDVASPLVEAPRERDLAATADAKRAAPAAMPEKSLTDLRDEIRSVRAMIETLTLESRAARRPELPSELVETYTRLLSAEVADELARSLLADVKDMGNDPVLIRAKLAERIAAMVPTCGPLSYGTDGGPRVVALVGPTGMGKTTTVAKLAANAKIRDRRRVGLITIDNFRIGAVEQLRTYAGILGVPFVAVTTADEMPAALEKMRDCHLVLMDTAGRSPKDELRIGELRTYLDAARPDEVHLVLASTHGEAAALEAVRRFAPLGAERVIFTKLDEAVGFGVILRVLSQVRLSLSYVTDGQSVPNDIAIAESGRIAELVLRPVFDGIAAPSERSSEQPTAAVVDAQPPATGRDAVAAVECRRGRRSERRAKRAAEAGGVR